MKRTIAVLVLAGMFSGSAQAHDYAAGDLTIGHPYAFATPQGARTGAGYFTVSNAGAEADRLLEVRADFPAVRLHASALDAAGVARMTHVGVIEIPPGGSVTIEPGGYHVMFMGLAEPLSEGAKIPATLVFEKAGEVSVEFAVQARAGGRPEHADH